MKRSRNRFPRRREPALEQRLDALENAVQSLTDALRGLEPQAPDPGSEPLPEPEPEPAGLTARLRDLLDRHVPADEPVAVVVGPELVLEDLGRPVAAIGPEAWTGAASVARLETQRAWGVRFVLVVAAATPGLEHDPLLAAHLAKHFRAVAGEAEVGVVLQASPRDETGTDPGLGTLLDSLVADGRLVPILDWTMAGLDGRLPGRTVVRPVWPEDEELPYLDGTLDIVLVDHPGRMEEAARVATIAVVLIAEDGAGGLTVLEHRQLQSGDGLSEPAAIVLATGAEKDWPVRVAECMEVNVYAAADPVAAALSTDAELVLLAEHGVLPLPGCIEAAERLLAREERLGGVAVKLFGADGSLEGAGGAAFADGTVEGIAAGAPPAAAWHEYVRPVPAAVGAVVMRTAVLRDIQSANGDDAFDVATLSARLWAGGWELMYEPDAAAVRVLAPAAGGASAWPEAVDGRPERPADLGDDSWRRLLSRRKVGALQ